MAVEILAATEPSHLQGKSVLVTGGASGLGLHAARYFVEAGAIVTIADIQDGTNIAADLNSKGCKMQYIHCDVTDWDSQVAAFQAALAFSPSRDLDAVVVYAGVDDSGHLVDYINAIPASFNGPPPPRPNVRPIDVNTTGVFYTATLALHYLRINAQAADHMAKSPKSLTIVSSLAGYIDDTHDSIYTASKFGSRGVFRAIRARANSELHVRVNLMAPWAMKTPMTAPILEKMAEYGIQEGKGITFVEHEVLTRAVATVISNEEISGMLDKFPSRAAVSLTFVSRSSIRCCSGRCGRYW